MHSTYAASKRDHDGSAIRHFTTLGAALGWVTGRYTVREMTSRGSRVVAAGVKP